MYNLTVGNDRIPFFEEWFFNYKHADDYWLLQTAMTQHHPQRVYDPSQAKLFFVPTLLNALLEYEEPWYKGVRKPLCKTLLQPLNPKKRNSTVIKCGVEKLWNHMNHLLGKSPWFRRNQGEGSCESSTHISYPTLYRRHDDTIRGISSSAI